MADSSYLPESPTVLWYVAKLRVRAPVGRHRLIEADVSTGIEVAWRDDPVERREAAVKQAGIAFYELGLGRIMDLPGAAVHIEVEVA